MGAVQSSQPKWVLALQLGWVLLSMIALIGRQLFRDGCCEELNQSEFCQLLGVPQLSWIKGLGVVE
jgi:hypothetical protein